MSIVNRVTANEKDGQLCVIKNNSIPSHPLHSSPPPLPLSPLPRSPSLPSPLPYQYSDPSLGLFFADPKPITSTNFAEFSAVDPYSFDDVALLATSFVIPSYPAIYKVHVTLYTLICFYLSLISFLLFSISIPLYHLISRYHLLFILHDVLISNGLISDQYVFFLYLKS